MKTFKLTITPAIHPKDRHIIEDTLRKIGYHVIGGGTDTDWSQCDITFEEKDKL